MASVKLAVTVFLISSATYLLLAGQVTGTELAAGLPTACAVAAFAALQHRRQPRPMRLRAPWPRVLLAPLLALLRDTVRVGAILGRTIVMPRSGATGTADRQPFRPGGDRPADAGRRALVTLATSFAPNGFALDIAPSDLLGDEPALLLHHLAPSPPEPDTEWPL